MALFCDKAEGLAATVARVGGRGAVPHAIAELVCTTAISPGSRPVGAVRGFTLRGRAKNHCRFARPSAGKDEVRLSHAFGGVGGRSRSLLAWRFRQSERPSTSWASTVFVVLDAADVAGDLEAVLGRLRDALEPARTVNLISGPTPATST